MSPPQSESTATSSAGPLENEALIRLLREELIKTQLIVLDLNDRVLEKETEKADAVVLLGKQAQILEEKLKLIGELQSAHEQELSGLREQLLTSEANGSAKDSAIREFSSRLATAQNEIGQLRGASEAQARDLVTIQQALATARAQSEQLTRQLERSEQSLVTVHQQLSTIRRSKLWKWSKPWRSMFGPKP
jgi:chromosome segregation ATPase